MKTHIFHLASVLTILCTVCSNGDVSGSMTNYLNYETEHDTVPPDKSDISEFISVGAFSSNDYNVLAIKGDSSL